MSDVLAFDWQTAVTLGIGLAALAYLVRRWWPAWRGLWQRPESASTMPCKQTAPGVSAPAATCGGGCGSCGSAATPQRDHRITVQRPPPDNP